jgi:hypothetical protein
MASQQELSQIRYIKMIEKLSKEDKELRFLPRHDTPSSKKSPPMPIKQEKSEKEGKEEGTCTPHNTPEDAPGFVNK